MAHPPEAELTDERAVGYHAMMRAIVAYVAHRGGRFRTQRIS